MENTVSQIHLLPYLSPQWNISASAGLFFKVPGSPVRSKPFHSSLICLFILVQTDCFFIGTIIIYLRAKSNREKTP